MDKYNMILNKFDLSVYFILYIFKIEIKIIKVKQAWKYTNNIMITLIVYFLINRKVINNMND